MRWSCCWRGRTRRIVKSTSASSSTIRQKERRRARLEQSPTCRRRRWRGDRGGVAVRAPSRRGCYRRGSCPEGRRRRRASRQGALKRCRCRFATTARRSRPPTTVTIASRTCARGASMRTTRGRSTKVTSWSLWLARKARAEPSPSRSRTSRRYHRRNRCHRCHQQRRAVPRAADVRARLRRGCYHPVWDLRAPVTARRRREAQTRR